MESRYYDKDRDAIVLRNYDDSEFDVANLIVLPQVRKTKNAKIDEIAQSMKDKALINPPDIARLGYEDFKRHITFINQLWKKDINPDSFKPIDGYYYVVIAGHTRIEGCKRMAKEYKHRVIIPVKIHHVKTSEEILAIQIDENLHSEPRIEEKAIAIIEMYQLGIANGKWKDKNEFAKQNPGNFSQHVIEDTLAFANLSTEAQEYVFSNNIPFTVGVELGRIFPLIEKFEREFFSQEEDIQENTRLYCGNILGEIFLSKSIKSSLGIILRHANHVRNYFKPKDESQQDMLGEWNNGAKIQGERHHKELEDAHKRALCALNSMPVERHIELLLLDTQLTGVDHTTEILHIRGLHNQFLNKQYSDDLTLVEMAK